MVAASAAKLKNAAIGRIQRRPKRILIIDVISQAERDGVFSHRSRGTDKDAKGVHRHYRVDRRDDRRDAGQAIHDQLEAGVGRGRRANNNVEIEISSMVVEPSVAIVARVIDDDGQSANSDRAEAIDCVVDKGSSADRRHRFADAIPISPQAAPEARGDDAPMKVRRS
ncbi:MAG: hypothetical protein WBY97_08700 [Roseiarcus sp.]